jgi:hypothetical protein
MMFTVTGAPAGRPQNNTSWSNQMGGSRSVT